MITNTQSSVRAPEMPQDHELFAALVSFLCQLPVERFDLPGLCKWRDFSPSVCPPAYSSLSIRWASVTCKEAGIQIKTKYCYRLQAFLVLRMAELNI